MGIKVEALTPALQRYIELTCPVCGQIQRRSVQVDMNTGILYCLGCQAKLLWEEENDG